MKGDKMGYGQQKKGIREKKRGEGNDCGQLIVHHAGKRGMKKSKQEKRDTHPWLFSITCDAVSLLLWQRGEEKQINLNRMPKGLIL